VVRQWSTDGTFEQLNAALRERVRSRLGRTPLPSAGIADPQSTKTTAVAAKTEVTTEANLLERPKKPAPEGVLMAWARKWTKEGVAVDWQKLMPPKGFVVLPRRWVAERTIAPTTRIGG
jgi:transposase